MRSRAIRLPVGLAALLLAAGALAAMPQFATSVDLVEVYATVTNRAGEPVTGLEASDFEVLEDGRPQVIQAFAPGRFPLSIALAVDHSASMAGRGLRTLREVALRFLGELRPEDQVMIVGVSSEVEVLAPLSRDRAPQRLALDRLRPWSTTSLNDAIIAGIDLIQPAHGRRGLVILSDGEDRYSQATPADVLAHARRADVMVYPIAIGKHSPPLFAEVAALTGGRSFQSSDPKKIDRALSEIAVELREQYLLGYAPARPETPKDGAAWHSIEVRVRRSGLQVRARDGYYGRR